MVRYHLIFLAVYISVLVSGLLGGRVGFVCFFFFVVDTSPSFEVPWKGTETGYILSGSCGLMTLTIYLSLGEKTFFFFFYFT